MKRFNALDRGKELRGELLKNSPFFADLNDIKASIKTREMIPDEISRAVVKINILLCNVGEVEAELRLKKDEAEAFRRGLYTHEKAISSGTVAERESIAETKIHDIRREEMALQYLYDWVRNFREDYRSLALSLQSRLNALRDERINANQL